MAFLNSNCFESGVFFVDNQMAGQQGVPAWSNS